MKKTVPVILTLLTLCLNLHAKETQSIVLGPAEANIVETTIRNYKTHLGNWNRPEDIIRFKVDQLDAGKYKIITVHACPDEHGGKVAIKLNDKEFKRTFGATGGWGHPLKKTIDFYEHTGGPVDISLTILKQNGQNQYVIDLYSLTLEKK